jgi:hypothetical protein
LEPTCDVPLNFNDEAVAVPPPPPAARVPNRCKPVAAEASARGVGHTAPHGVALPRLIIAGSAMLPAFQVNTLGVFVYRLYSIVHARYIVVLCVVHPRTDR